MRWLLVCMAFWVTAFPCHRAMATGAPANTAISTQAVATYVVGASSFSQSSNVVVATVAEVLDVVVTWQDGTAISVVPEETNRILTFRVTNTGNGTEQFVLTAVNTLTGDDFDPALAGLFLDSNANGIYDAGIDPLYVAGSNDPVLVADAGLTIFAAGDIPQSVQDGDNGLFQLTASAVSGHGLPGTLISGQGDGGTDAIVGATGAQSDAQGNYAVTSVTIAVTKSAVVLDPYGGNRPTTGAVITYQVLVQAQGSGTASNVIFSDPIPADTSYSPNSLNLNAATLTDAADSDAGDVGFSAADTVTVNLGNLSSGTPVQTISFAVTIN